MKPINETVKSELDYKKPNLVIESAIFAQPEKVKKYTDGKVIFEAYLQEADARNQNKRYYPKRVLETGMNRVSEKIKRRAYLGELDHPITDDQVRQTTVLYKEASHLITDWGWEGNIIRGVVETTPYSPNGKTMTGLILDRVPVGFSLRGLADLTDNGSYQEVLDPLIAITYDCVSEPSHHIATIQEIRNENVVRVVKESINLITCSNGHKYEINTFDMLVEKKILNLAKRYNQL